MADFTSATRTCSRPSGNFLIVEGVRTPGGARTMKIGVLDDLRNE